MAKKTEHKAISMPPKEEDLILAQKNDVDRAINNQIEAAENSIEYDSVSKEEGEMVRFTLEHSSNERLQDPLPVRVNGMSYSIPRGIDVEYPRFVVALVEKHYLPIYVEKINPYTNSKKKRKVKERIYESVRLRENKTTGTISKIDRDRQEKLATLVDEWRKKQLLKQA